MTDTTEPAGIGTLPQVHCPPPHPSPRKPSIQLPANSCDSHCHIFGPSDLYPYAPDRTFTPPDVPLARLADLHRHLGISRAVIVQSSCHGSDHRLLIDALREGKGNYRGVGLISSATSPTQLDLLDRAGVRGARLHFMPHLGDAPDSEEIDAVTARLAELGWHAEVHVSGEGIMAAEKNILALPVPVVVDHLARVDLRQGLESPSVHALLRLISSGKVWVKVSGIDRVSVEGPPYTDAVELAARLVREAPERVLWGSDFPHPNIVGESPDDGLLAEQLQRIAPTTELLRLLMVDNPTEFFGF